MRTTTRREDDHDQSSAFVSDLAAGDSYAPWYMDGPGAWQELLEDPVQRGDETCLHHVCDDGASPAIFDASTLVRVR
ncbi:hypothetical protein E1287_30605 [Actinomadura sp. KC06]|uniref:hypothetical protein n=1 Tax=Actinomadura sp. KC06 TaxID=2530369 RepID=UPI00104F57ED|nr:hypothetical protein [Actinomadura sp. KC06]TDD29634.1 hypothetical protein E1287_30605 [Actinomadura sp. KC06]